MVEWIQVDAHCIATRKMGMTGTDNYREAFGIGSRFLGQTTMNYTRYYNDTSDHFFPVVAPGFYDYLFCTEDKYKYTIMDGAPLDWLSTCYDDADYSIVGRGVGTGNTGTFAVEPMLLMKNPKQKSPYQIMIPGLEVNVMVYVKMKDREEPIVLSRNYLPKVETCYYWDLKEDGKLHQRINNRKLNLNPKQKGHTTCYDYQLERMSKVVELLEDYYHRN